MGHASIKQHSPETNRSYGSTAAAAVKQWHYREGGSGSLYYTVAVTTTHLEPEPDSAAALLLSGCHGFTISCSRVQHARSNFLRWTLLNQLFTRSTPWLTVRVSGHRERRSLVLERQVLRYLVLGRRERRSLVLGHIKAGKNLVAESPRVAIPSVATWSFPVGARPQITPITEPHLGGGGGCRSQGWLASSVMGNNCIIDSSGVEPQANSVMIN